MDCSRKPDLRLDQTPPPVDPDSNAEVNRTKEVKVGKRKAYKSVEELK